MLSSATRNYKRQQRFRLAIIKDLPYQVQRPVRAVDTTLVRGSEVPGLISSLSATLSFHPYGFESQWDIKEVHPIAATG